MRAIRISLLLSFWGWVALALRAEEVPGLQPELWGLLAVGSALATLWVALPRKLDHGALAAWNAMVLTSGVLRSWTNAEEGSWSQAGLWWLICWLTIAVSIGITILSEIPNGKSS